MVLGTSHDVASPDSSASGSWTVCTHWMVLTRPSFLSLSLSRRFCSKLRLNHASPLVQVVFARVSVVSGRANVERETKHLHATVEVHAIAGIASIRFITGFRFSSSSTTAARLARKATMK